MHRGFVITTCPDEETNPRSKWVVTVTRLDGSLIEAPGYENPDYDSETEEDAIELGIEIINQFIE